MKIPNKVRYVNKRFTNRLMMKIAGKKHSPIVLIEHIGRLSGKVLPVPIMAAPYRGLHVCPYLRNRRRLVQEYSVISIQQN